VWSSPLQRAYRTAQLAGFETPETDPDLREWNYGAYDGKTKADIREMVPDWNIWTHGVKDGETLEQVANRARSVLSRAQAVEGDVILFSHGHLLRILACCWQGIPPQNAEHLALSTGAISVLGWDDGYPALTRWNCQPEQP